MSRVTDALDSPVRDPSVSKAAAHEPEPTGAVPRLDIGEPPVPEPRAIAYRPALAVLGVTVLALLAIYWRTAASIVSIWMGSQTFTHGFLVVPMTGWLIWRERARLAGLPVAPNLRLLPIIGLLGSAWLVGRLGAVNAVTQFAFVSMLIGTVPIVMGMRFARAIAFPLAFLLFAVPFGEFALPTLMRWTADFTVMALRTSGIPVYREGLFFVIPSGNWSVIEACSGVRYLIASFMMGTLYAYLTYRTVRRRLAFMALSIAMPIVANWLRAYMIVMIGHLSSNRLAVGVDHLIYGWVFFGLVMAVMFWIGARWQRGERVPATGGLPPIPSIAPERAAAFPAIATTAAALVCMAAAFPVADELMRARRAAAPPELGSPGMAAGWSAVESPSASYKPAFRDPSAEFQRIYDSSQGRVGLYIAYYRDQDATRKLVSSENVLVRSTDPTWRQVANGRSPARVGTREVQVTTASLRGTGITLQVRAFYWIDGRLTSNDYVAKVYTALAQVLGRGDDSAAIVVYAPDDSQRSDSRALDAFLADNGEAILSALRTTREQR